MIDPATGLAILGTAVGSAKVVEKLLGPTSEYLGAGLKNWTERKVNNVGKIFESAQKKLGSKIDSEGAVPPKVLKGILTEGSFCDDELAADYYGGVLASSRTNVSRDDRGAQFVDLVSRLTTYQIRSHFIFYSLFRNLFSGQIGITKLDIRQKLQVYLPFESYISAMDFTETEDFQQIIPHVMFGLDKEKLLDHFEYGQTKDIKKYGDSGIIVTPSVLGAELFLWANGNGNVAVNTFLTCIIEIPVDIQISIPSDAKSTAKLDEQKNEEIRKAASIAQRLKAEF